MEQYINKSALVAEIERRIKERDFQMKSGCWVSSTYMYEDLLDFINTLEVEESGETAEAFARIIRANLTGIDKDVQYKFEQLYKEVTGEKMYQGYND